MIIRGVYNSSSPSLSNHQYCDLQMDSSGNLKVSGSLTVDSEFPTAAALSDSIGNPTTTLVGACALVWDGSHWVRATTGGVTPGTQRVYIDDFGAAITVNSITPGTSLANLGKSEDQASANTDVGVAAMVVRKATPSNTSDTDGDYECLQVSGGRLWVSQPTPFSTDISAALEASSVSKNSAGIFYGIFGRIDSTAASATYYLQILNAASVPADGAVTFLINPRKYVHTTGTDTNIDIDLRNGGISAGTGIVWCLSSTEFTKTIAGSLVSATSLYI